MSQLKRMLRLWLPAIGMMAVIFLISAQPAANLPDFDLADRLVKKSGHVTGYALLAVSVWRALGFRQEKGRLAWLVAVLYAVSDEFHQAFVPERHPSIWDVLIFDNLGALVGIWLVERFRLRRSDRSHGSVERLKPAG